MNPNKIAIVGGGIGGLTAAIALRQKGHYVVVYDAAPTIRPLGAGLGLAANAVKAFIDIGIGESVLKAGKVLKVLRIKDERGRVLTETDSEKLARQFGVVNSFTIHRADLHDVLISHLSPGTLVLDKRLKGLSQEGSNITLRFADNTTAKCMSFESIVDGPRSTVHGPRRIGVT